ncbi:MAG TPA: GTP cyclohydrolase II, partial [Rhodobacterales bacterium]|nr:GTP cyclohydrolase II [Rhodobacterales bacterium]
MTLEPDAKELAARARADLRVGLPIVLGLDGAAGLVAAAETLSADRLADIREAGTPVLAITPRRAETLKARAYSDHVARVILPADAGCDWVENVANPADDLMMPLKGPLATERGGDERIAHAALRLTKSAHLLPAALVLPLEDGHSFAALHGLTWLDLTGAEEILSQTGSLTQVSAARVPLEVSRAGRVMVFRPSDGGEEHYAVEIGHADRAQP